MKRIISLILALTLSAFALASCDKSTSEDNDSEKDNSDEYVTDLDGLYDYDLTEYISLPDLESFEINYEIVEVSDSTVESEISSALENAAEDVNVTDRAAKNGDILNVDFVGRLADSGEEFDGGSAKGTKITLGAGGYIDGFEEALVGMFPGETKSAPMTFPETYTVNPDMAGVAVIFEFTLNSITEKIIPELDDDFVESLKIDDVETVDEYRSHIREGLEDEAEKTTETNKIGAVWNYLYEGCSVKKYPEKELADAREAAIDYVEKYADNYNVTVEDLVAQSFGGDNDQYEQYLTSRAESTVQSELVVYYLIHKYDVKVTNSKYLEKLSEYYKLYASNYGVSDIAAFEKAATRKTIVSSIFYDIIMEKAVAGAKWVETVDEVTAE